MRGLHAAEGGVDEVRRRGRDALEEHLGDVFLVGRHRPARQLGHGLEQTVEADRPRVGNELEQVADQQLGEPERHLRVAHVRFDREVGDVLRGGAEDRRHARLVEVPPVAQKVCGRLDRQVAPPLQRADREPAVLVHDPGREDRRRTIDGDAQVSIEKAHAELRDLGVAAVDGEKPDLACRDGDGENRLFAVDRRQADHVDEARQHRVREPGPSAVDLGDDLVGRPRQLRVAHLEPLRVQRLPRWQVILSHEIAEAFDAHHGDGGKHPRRSRRE